MAQIDHDHGHPTETGDVIGLIAVTAAGRDAAERLARAWPGETRGYPGPAATALPRAWAECDALVCFLATGATIRLIAPLLASKHTDPAVVRVDQASRHAIALLGGHGSGANLLATRVAGVLGADPVLSTATDAAGLPGLDTLGWPAEGAVAAVSRAMLDGKPVRLDSDSTWPLRPGTRVLSSGLGAEEERARAAVTEAQRGHAVALVGSGDAGVYSMASPALSLAGEDIDVVTVPGITANLAAAALLGAPLGHDHAVISLSDLNTPWEAIERRVRSGSSWRRTSCSPGCSRTGSRPRRARSRSSIRESGCGWPG